MSKEIISIIGASWLVLGFYVFILDSALSEIAHILKDICKVLKEGGTQHDTGRD